MALPKLPDRIAVLGEWFRIELIAGPKDKEGTLLSGYTDGERRLFVIDSNLDVGRQWETLVHEYVHGALYVNGVANVITDELQEVIAQTLEHAICQLVRAQKKHIVQGLGRDGE